MYHVLGPGTMPPGGRLSWNKAQFGHRLASLPRYYVHEYVLGPHGPQRACDRCTSSFVHNPNLQLREHVEECEMLVADHVAIPTVKDVVDHGVQVLEVDNLGELSQEEDDQSVSKLAAWSRENKLMTARDTYL